MKWGILASGTIAAKFARTVNAMSHEGESLIAVGSRSARKARAFADEHGIPKAYGSYEELAADPDVEAIYIATPNNLHYENALLCLNAGKHVLCEKPFTTNAADAQKLYKTAEEKGLFIMEAFRFTPNCSRSSNPRNTASSATRAATTALSRRGPDVSANSSLNWAAARCSTSASITWAFCTWSWALLPSHSLLKCTSTNSGPTTSASCN